ncbi:MAG: Chemotaxis response regulator protein-glutamate methylesterase CheB, partial [uncultured Blastococcus sp.]
EPDPGDGRRRFRRRPQDRDRRPLRRSGYRGRGHRRQRQGCRGQARAAEARPDHHGHRDAGDGRHPGGPCHPRRHGRSRAQPRPDHHVQHADRARRVRDPGRPVRRCQRVRHQAGERRQRRAVDGERPRAADPQDQGAHRSSGHRGAGPHRRSRSAAAPGTAPHRARQEARRPRDRLLHRRPRGARPRPPPVAGLAPGAGAAGAAHAARLHPPVRPAAGPALPAAGRRGRRRQPPPPRHGAPGARRPPPRGAGRRARPAHRPEPGAAGELLPPGGGPALPFRGHRLRRRRPGGRADRHGLRRPQRRGRGPRRRWHRPGAGPGELRGLGHARRGQPGRIRRRGAPARSGRRGHRTPPVRCRLSAYRGHCLRGRTM